MISVSELVANGYREYKAACYFGDWYKQSYQKQMSDAKGVRYLITIHYAIQPPLLMRPGREIFSPSHQYSLNGILFNVEMLYQDESLKEIEDFFDGIWIKLSPDYYKRPKS